MFVKYILICLFILKRSYCYKSVVFVIDSTESMQDELHILKQKLPSVFLNANTTDIDEYILVTFKDPDVSEPLVVQSPDDLIIAVNRLKASGGNDCPENTLSAIEQALRRSKPKSNIFVFTDAYAEDAYKLSTLENLCRNTRSQVVIFSLHYCTTTPTVNIQTYYNVAKACQGAVFSLEDDRDIRQIFGYIKEVIKEDWTNIITEQFTYTKSITFSVNSFTNNVLLAVSGNHPSLTISLDGSTKATNNKVLDSKHVQVYRLLQPSPGVYSVTIRSQGETSVILYKKVELSFQIGFSTEKPRSIKETSYRPIPGRQNYVLIQVLSSFKPEDITMEVFNDHNNITLDFAEMPNDNLYLAKTFIAPDKSFCLWIRGYDKLTGESITGSTMTVIPQIAVMDTEWRRPTAEIIDEIPVIVEYGTNATIACKVIGYPRPNIWWEDENGVTLTNTSTEGILLELPLLYISYLHIENGTSNHTVYCKCNNSQGDDTKSINIYIHRPYTFEVIQTPENQTIIYGSDGKLYCQVSAYPEATVEWYHNDTIIIEDDFEILPEEHALQIINIDLDKAGEYRCKISNVANTKMYTAYVDVSGIEAPEVEMDQSKVVIMLGDSASLTCRVTQGTPTPELRWEFKSGNGIDFSSLPESVEVDGDNIRISSAQNEHDGIYRCKALNVAGQHSVDVTLIVQSPPIISNGESRIVLVKEADEVVLPCYVTGSPTPTVRWEMSQDDVIIKFDDRHKTDADHTHRFTALWKDSGNYHCIAENSAGKSEVTITVNVLVKPYIEAMMSDSITVQAGATVNLTCEVSYGNPVPTTKWEFTPTSGGTRVLKRSNSSSVLKLKSVRHSDAGMYVCVANNDVGTDTIKTYLHVQ